MFSKLPEHIDYGHRVLLFCDVLGWAKFIEERQHEDYYRDRIIDVFGEIWHLAETIDEIKNQGTQIDFDLTIGHFSDGFVLSCLYSHEAVSLLARHAAYVSNEILKYGFLCRGAIVGGSLFHDGQLVFGPALVKAERMEREVAVYPRILVEWDLVGEIAEGAQLRCDSDGLHSVDIFGSIWRQTEADVVYNKADLAEVRKFISNALQKYKPDPKEHTKWSYAAKRFNDFVAIHPELGLLHIDQDQIPAH